MQKSIESWIKAALIILFILFIMAFIFLRIQLNELEKQKEDLEIQIKTTNDRITEIQYALDTEFNEEYIIRVARERLNLHLPDEIVYYNDLLK